MFMIFFNCLIPKRNLSIVNFLEQQLWLEIFCLVLKMGGGSKKHPVYLPPFSSFPSQLSTGLKSFLFYIYILDFREFISLFKLTMSMTSSLFFLCIMLPLVEMSKGHEDSKNSNESLLCYVCDSLKDPDCGSEDPEVISDEGLY